MVRKIRYLTTDCTYKDAQALLSRYGFRSFPLVESRGKYFLPLSRYGFRSAQSLRLQVCSVAAASGLLSRCGFRSAQSPRLPLIPSAPC